MDANAKRPNDTQANQIPNQFPNTTEAMYSASRGPLNQSQRILARGQSSGQDQMMTPQRTKASLFHRHAHKIFGKRHQSSLHVATGSVFATGEPSKIVAIRDRKRRHINDGKIDLCNTRDKTLLQLMTKKHIRKFENTCIVGPVKRRQISYSDHQSGRPG